MRSGYYKKNSLVLALPSPGTSPKGLDRLAVFVKLEACAMSEVLQSRFTVVSR